MNRVPSHVLLRLEPVSGLRPKNRSLRIPSNARSPLGSTPDSCRFRGQSQQGQAAGDELTVGFLRHRRAKRMMGMKKDGPVSIPQTGPGRSFFPPSPGYPSLGCTPAEPNSVSPGNIHHTSSSRCPLKIDKRAHRAGHQKHQRTGNEVAQNLTARTLPTGPKPTEPDHRLRRPDRGQERTMLSKMTAANLTPAKTPLQ